MQIAVAPKVRSVVILYHKKILLRINTIDTLVSVEPRTFTLLV